MAWSVFVRRQVQRKQQKQQYQMQKLHLLVVAWLENLRGPIFESGMHHNTPGNWNTVRLSKGLGVVIKMGWTGPELLSTDSEFGPLLLFASSDETSRIVNLGTLCIKQF